MRDSDKLELEVTAVPAWHYLEHDIREELKAFLESIAGTPPETWPPRARKWAPTLDVYAVSTWVKGHEMITFVRPEGDKLYIEGFSMREMIDKLRKEAGYVA